MRSIFAPIALGSAALVTWLLLGSGCGIDDRMLRAGAADSGPVKGDPIQDGDGADGAIQGCTAANTVVAPSYGVIANFTGDAALFPYGSGGPTGFAQNDGVLTIHENQAPGTVTQYPGLTLAFSTCIDASAFSGVQFTISGTLSGCTMQYSTDYTEDAYAANSPLASCSEALCYSPQFSIVPTTTATTLHVPWSSLTKVTNVVGVPVADPDDPARIVGFAWQFAVPAQGDGDAQNCLADVDITDFKFYR